MYVDRSLPAATVRSNDCKLLLPPGYTQSRCSNCIKNRATISRQLSRSVVSVASHTTPSSHTNYRFLNRTQLVSRLQQTHHQLRLSVKQIDRLKTKIADAVAQKGIQVDEELHSGLQQIMSTESSRIANSLTPDSFQQLFWQQQHEAAKKSSAKGMKWHPMMIRWCIYLRHKSSGAYELLRESGCLKLPSQRTLRDYTYYVKAKVGFSGDVDQMLNQAAKASSTSEELAQYVLLLVDEMHIREDLVYDKYSRELIGFTNLGEINQHLLAFERTLSEEAASDGPLANSMTMFMVRGLFTKLQFAYAQFPCNSVSGDLLYDPFWEAVYRMERCGLKVCLYYRSLLFMDAGVI